MNKDEKSYSKKQINIAILTMVGGILAFCITQFLTIRNENLQREHEKEQTYSAAMLSDRLVIYKDACKSVGEIMANVEADSPELHKSITDFNKIYFGEMALIENTKIIASAQNFRIACDLFLKSKRDNNDKKLLRKIAVEFTQVCRDTSKKEWEELNVKK